MAEKAKLSGPAPGFAASPDHTVAVEPCPSRVRMIVGGETVADSRRALRMLESNHKPVFYFPRADLRMDLMERTAHSSF